MGYGLEDSLAEAIVETERFHTAVHDIVDEVVKDAASDVIKDEDIDQQVNEALTDAMENKFAEVDEDISLLKNQFQFLMDENKRLQDEILNLKNESIFTFNSIRELSRLVEKTRNTLRKVPILNRYM